MGKNATHICYVRVRAPDDCMPVDVTLLRVVKHNEVMQTCTESSLKPSRTPCARDVITMSQQLKKCVINGYITIKIT